MSLIDSSLISDIEKIGSISIIPSILEVICKTTGMGFAAVARVTNDKWIACAVKDEIKFGLLPGGELKLDTTICHEIRQSGQPVIIDEVAKDEFYSLHHTPAMYGFQSYISIPVRRHSGDFFGTLCAIDPRPALLNTPEIIGMFKVYAQLIAIHLDAMELLPIEKLNTIQEGTGQAIAEQLATINGAKQLNIRSKEFANVIVDTTNRVKAYIETINLKA